MNNNPNQIKDKKGQQMGVEDVTFEKPVDPQAESEKQVEKEPEKGGPVNADSKKSRKSASQKKIKELEEKIEVLNDKYLRLYSEFDNYRKRTVKERVELQMSASKDLILEILPVVDDFERAIQSFEDHNLSKEANKGIQLVYNKFMNILKQKGLEAMDVKNKEFDTDFMEAITNIPAPTEKLKGKVVDVVQPGYLLNGKILRFAKVVVGQ